MKQSTSWNYWRWRAAAVEKKRHKAHIQSWQNYMLCTPASIQTASGQLSDWAWKFIYWTCRSSHMSSLWSYTVSTEHLQIYAFLKKSEPKCWPCGHNLSSSLKERWSKFAAMDICNHISRGVHPAYDYIEGNVTHPFVTRGTVSTSSLWH